MRGVGLGCLGLRSVELSWRAYTGMNIVRFTRGRYLIRTKEGKKEKEKKEEKEKKGEGVVPCKKNVIWFYHV